MEVKFYPYDFTYKVKDDLSYIYLFSKLENGAKICVIEQFDPYFYADINKFESVDVEKRLKDFQIEENGKIFKILSWSKEEKELLGKKNAFLKIVVNVPNAVTAISKEFGKWGIDCYENDFYLVHRYLRDKKLTPLTLMEAKGDFVDDKNMRVSIFLTENVVQLSKECLDKQKILAIDIETYAQDRIINPEKNPILMIAFYGLNEKNEEFRKVITWKRFEHKLSYLEVVSDEMELLKRFREIMLDYQPDIVTGYFSDGFDFPYLKIRANKFKLKLDLGLDYSELDTGRHPDLRDGKTQINGILHLDMFKFIKRIFGRSLKTDSYSLDAVSEELLGQKKHAVNLDDLAHIWDNNPEELKDFCEYNLHDAHLTLKLCHKLMYDMIEFTKIIGLPLFEVTRMSFSRLVENYILKRAQEYNVLAPNKPKNKDIEQRSEETYQGAFVYQPTPGLYQDIIVFDFRSLYPTIITAHNIGPESLHCACCKKETKVPEQEEYWFCKKEKKFIPKVLEQIILRRTDLKRLIKETQAKNEDTTILEARSYALKLLANAFYGYLGFFGARWYCIECARSTTAYARNYIQRTIKKAEEKGFQVVYGDTDSLFILLGDQLKDEAMEFMNEINFDLPGYMELEYEGLFKRGIFVAMKSSSLGAKKKYALMDENGRMKVTGFEAVRRNWSLLAKEVQTEVLKLILNNHVEEALSYVRNVTKELKKGKISLGKLIIKTQITKDLSHYTSIGPHVAVATKMLEKGVPIIPGTVVQYIIAKGSGIIRDRAKLPEEVKNGEYDADYYLNNQLLPAVSSIFLVLGYKEEDLHSESSQMGLGKFF